MKDLVNYQPNLPEVHIPQQHLMEPTRHIEYIAWKSRLAMDAQSSTHLYAVLKLMMTVQQAELLKDTANGRLPPEAEQAYRKLTEEYAATIEAIPQQVAARLLEELQQMPEDLRDQGFLARLRALLGE
jgi:hypothetical protein